MSPAGEERDTLVIITTDADPCMAGLRHRMPVVLDRDPENDRLDPAITSTREALGVLERRAGVRLHASPVSRLANRPSVDGQELIRPLA
jgi:putative SOS response-associated peptidase YedK